MPTPKPPPLRDVPAPAIALIKAFEGIPDGDPTTVNIDAYLCPAGVWTIGWGHAIVDGGAQLKGAQNRARARALYPGGITLQQAETLLAADLLPRCASVLSLARVPLTDGMLGALVAFVFNVGAANFAASTLLKRLNLGDRAGAADQFLAWDKARVNGVLKPLAGLTRRRRAERALFLGEDWQVAALPAAPAVSRSRSRSAAVGLEGALPAGPSRSRLKPLPVPEPPERTEPTPQGSVQKAAGRAAKTAAPARAATPRGRTTPPKAPPPKPPAKRPARRTAR